MRRFLILFVFFLSLASTGQSPLSTDEGKALVSAVEASLAQSVQSIDDLKKINTAAIENAFLALGRSQDSEARELKYALIHWRGRTVEKLIKWGVAGSDSDFVASLESINGLAVELDSRLYQQLFQRLELSKTNVSREVAWKQLRRQRPLDPRHVEPGWWSNDPVYRIVPTRHVEKTEVGNPQGAETSVDQSDVNSWSSQTLDQLAQASVIETAPDEGESAYRFRGRLVLKPGDIVLLEQNIDFCRDLNTCISEPISQFSHAGIFLEIEQEKKRIPAVLEVYSHGLRILPAELYLGRRFSHYTEVHRFKEATPSWAASLRDLGERYSKEMDQWCYDFHAKEFNSGDKDREKTANCSNLPSHVLIELGCEPISSRCAVARGAEGLLASLGLSFKNYLTPTDYKRDPRLQLVGVVDTLDLESLLAQELVIRNPKLGHTVAGILAKSKWVPGKMSFTDRAMYNTKASLMAGITAKNSRSLWTVNQTTEWPWKMTNFPNAPAELIAFIQLIEPPVEKAVQSLRHELLTHRYYRELKPFLTPATQKSPGAAHLLSTLSDGNNGHFWFSISEVENDPLIGADVNERLKPLKKWFTAPDSK